MFTRPWTLTVLLASLVTVPASAEIISVPNGSFESPYLEMVSPYATSQIDHWQKAPVPDWWTGAGYGADQWRDSAGVFLNVPFAPIDNMDGRQAAFMFSPPGYELFQDLAATFLVGRSYHLIVGIEGGGYGMQLGVPMEIRLYYRDESGDRITVGATEAQNTNDTGAMTSFTDHFLDIPTVADGDPWAGKPIGVQLISTSTFENAGGYWNIDNVRLSAVPEPGSALLLAMGLCAFGVWRWRASGRKV